jgi:hypothetical protein
MKTLEELERQILAAFPPRKVNQIVTHQCEECESLKRELGGRVWSDISAEFIEANDGALPLLTQDAYLAFLPAWLLQSTRNPKGAAAGMVPVNLGSEPDTQGFSRAQAVAIMDTVRFITCNNSWGEDDPGNIESLKKVTAVWSNVAM